MFDILINYLSDLIWLLAVKYLAPQIAGKLVEAGQDKYMNNISTKNKNSTIYKALQIATLVRQFRYARPKSPSTKKSNLHHVGLFHELVFVISCFLGSWTSHTMLHHGSRKHCSNIGSLQRSQAGKDKIDLLVSAFFSMNTPCIFQLF